MDRRLLLDKGGRRSGVDRRKYSYTVHIPERRLSKDRRQNAERRCTRIKYSALGKKKGPGEGIAVY